MKKYICILGIMMIFLLCSGGNNNQKADSDKLENISNNEKVYLKQVENNSKDQQVNSIVIEDNIKMLHADYLEYDSAQSLVDAADLVFTGIVKDISYKMLSIRTGDGSDPMTGLEDNVMLPYTIFKIEISKIYKGEFEDDTIYLKRLGGNFDSCRYELEGASEINMDGNYLFAAQTYENSYASLLNADQSSYDLDVPVALFENDNITLSQILAIFK